LFVDGVNRYLYARNNPSLFVDLSGHRTVTGKKVALVSWIDKFNFLAAFEAVNKKYRALFGHYPDGAKARAMPILLALLLKSANPSPPKSFAIPTGWRKFVRSKEYRGYIFFQPQITCSSGGIVTSSKVIHDDWSKGYTPTFGTVQKGRDHSDAEGRLRRTTTGIGGKCQQFTRTVEGRVKVGQGAARKVFGGVPYISTRIEYTLCCACKFSVSYHGSFFPSHKAYLEVEGALTVRKRITSLQQVGQQKQDRLQEFIFLGDGVVAPMTRFATKSGTV